MRCRHKICLAPTGRTPPTSLPPDRPIDAAPDRIEDAAQEFLTDWLVRRKYDEALAVLSPRALACVNLTGDGKDQELDADGAAP